MLFWELALMKKEYLDIPLSVKQLTSDEKNYQYEGFASSWNIDSDDDRIARGAFLDSIDLVLRGSRVIPALWQHMRYEPIGKYVELKENEDGLFVRATMPKSDTFVSGRVWPQLEHGSVGSMSIGFYPKEWEWVEEEGRQIRVLKKVDLKEISLVTFPANEDAEVTGIKKSCSKIENISELTERELEKILKNGVSFSNSQAKQVIKGLSLLHRDDEVTKQREVEKRQNDLLALCEKIKILGAK